MADSRTELILQAIVATLAAAGKPAGSVVNRSRLQAVRPDELPMFSVYPIDEAVKLAGDKRQSPITERSFTLRVRCRVAGADAALDPLRQWVVKSLGGNPSLNGLALNLEELGGPWAAKDASDDDYSVCEMDFRVRYTTARGDLTKPA